MAEVVSNSVLEGDEKSINSEVLNGVSEAAVNEGSVEPEPTRTEEEIAILKAFGAIVPKRPVAAPSAEGLGKSASSASVSNEPHAPDNETSADVRAWLVSVNRKFASYHDDFVAQGFDSIGAVALISSKDLETLVAKRGHRVQLQRAIEQLRAPPTQNGNASATSGASEAGREHRASSPRTSDRALTSHRSDRSATSEASNGRLPVAAGKLEAASQVANDQSQAAPRTPGGEREASGRKPGCRADVASASDGKLEVPPKTTDVGAVPYPNERNDDWMDSITFYHYLARPQPSTLLSGVVDVSALGLDGLESPTDASAIFQDAARRDLVRSPFQTSGDQFAAVAHLLSLTNPDGRVDESVVVGHVIEWLLVHRDFSLVPDDETAAPSAHGRKRAKLTAAINGLVSSSAKKKSRRPLSTSAEALSDEERSKLEAKALKRKEKELRKELREKRRALKHHRLTESGTDVAAPNNLESFVKARFGLSWDEYLEKVRSWNAKAESSDNRNAGDAVTLIAAANAFDVRIFLWSTESSSAMTPVHLYPAGKKALEEHPLKVLKLFQVGPAFEALVTRHQASDIAPFQPPSAKPLEVTVVPASGVPDGEVFVLRHDKQAPMRYFADRKPHAVTLRDGALFVGAASKDKDASTVRIPLELVWTQRPALSPESLQVVTPFTSFSLSPSHADDLAYPQRSSALLNSIEAATKSETRTVRFKYPESGDVYNGGLKRGLHHGYGEHHVPNAFTYLGDWADGTRAGPGVIKFSDETKFQGLWSKGLPADGELGKIWYANGDKFEGHVRGVYSKLGRPVVQRHGGGLLLFDAGRSYFIGSWLEDKRHGFGSQRSVYGDMLRGQWEADELSGAGLHVSHEGVTYVGNWSHGLRSKRGYLLYDNGDVFSGKWKAQHKEDPKEVFTGTRICLKAALTDEHNHLGRAMKRAVDEFARSPALEHTALEESSVVVGRITKEIFSHLELEEQRETALELVPLRRLCHRLIYGKLYRYIFRWYSYTYQRQDLAAFRAQADDQDKDVVIPKEAQRLLRGLPECRSPLEKYERLQELFLLLSPSVPDAIMHDLGPDGQKSTTAHKETPRLRQSLLEREPLRPKIRALVHSSVLPFLASELHFLKDFAGTIPTFSEEPDASPRAGLRKAVLQFVADVIAFIDDTASKSGDALPEENSADAELPLARAHSSLKSSIAWDPNDIKYRDHEMYIPQYCAMLASHSSDTSPLYAFLFKTSSAQLHFALKMHWMLSTVVEKMATVGKPAAPLARDFLGHLERLWATKFNSVFRSHTMFVAELVDLKTNTAKQLDSLNLTLPFRNLYIPFSRGTEHAHLIVHFPVKEAKVFQSKTAPMLLVSEVLVDPEATFASDSLERTLGELGAAARPARWEPDAAQDADPAGNLWPLKEYWEHKKRRIRLESPFGGLGGWDLSAMIVKYDDCLNESIAMQLIEKFQEIFRNANLSLWLRPYKIFLCSMSIALIELLTDIISVSNLRKEMSKVAELKDKGLLDYFKRKYGPVESEAFKAAQTNFIQSLAAYSLVSFFLQIKDRHNENIMLDMDGHIIHIDFGFSVGSYPGERGVIALWGPGLVVVYREGSLVTRFDGLLSSVVSGACSAQNRRNKWCSIWKLSGFLSSVGAVDVTVRSTLAVTHQHPKNR
eukprot:TRINITY_DN10814_c0_g1_i2.p1 TRINITY_DN10814_c0_g1~~TRINITY_DN10814_c0_g1_i2.p1  ORF type:complete len:1649 (+),score=582.59 TRINITY_DN10814_c0_g1_i2:109-5055(+)